MTGLDLNAAEQRILDRSHDLGATRRRIRSVAVMSSVLVVVLFYARPGIAPDVLFWVFVGYVVLTGLEKLAYGVSVLGYKRVIQKLAARVRELEGVGQVARPGGGEPAGDEAGSTG